jgi:hypothetical protein
MNNTIWYAGQDEIYIEYVQDTLKLVEMVVDSLIGGGK